MKSTSLAIAAVSLLQVVSAQPHRRRHVHAVEHQNAKKDDLVVTIIDTVYAQATEVPEVIVYVDENGNPISTTTEYQQVSQTAWSTAYGVGPSATYIPVSSSSTSETASTSSIPVVENVQVAVASPAAPEPSTTTSVPEVPSTIAVATPVPTTPVEVAAPVVVTTPEVAPVATTTAQAVPVATPTAASSSGSGFGLSYSPYNGDGTCKTQDQVNTDFESISGYSLIRIYGTDCNQVTTVLSVCKAKGLKLFAGVFDISAVNTEIATIIAAAKGDWSLIETISIGNELVNNGAASASSVIAAIGTARALLKAANYTGKVVTVDTLVAARANPSLCDASDFCAVNCHPFFDGSYAAADSGKFLSDMIPTLAAVLANKNQEIVITETGWPWKGQTNGKAIPSMENQAAAISSIRAKFASTPNAVILFTAFNDMWKKNSPVQYEAEQFWGMGGNNPPSG